MAFKYIVVDGHMCDEFFMFPDLMDHADFARSVENRGKVSSAGFVKMNHDGEPYCYGRSTSLGIESDANDTRIMQRFFGVFE